MQKSEPSASPHTGKPSFPGSTHSRLPSTKAADARVNSTRRARRYSIVVVLVQVLAMFAFVGISGTRWFLRHNDDSHLLYTLGYGLRLKHADCDIVVYGDSTALTGVDPQVIEAKTGLKTCNVAEMRPVQWIIGSYFPLDQYLAHNRPPKVLFTYWSAAEFHPNAHTFTFYAPEGMVYALQYDRGAYIAAGLLRHPSWFLSYSLWVEYRLVAAAALVTTTHQKLIPDLTTRDARNGLWVEPNPPQTRCKDYPRPERSLTVDQENAAVQEFRKRYAVNGTRVIVDVSAWPACAMDLKQRVDETRGRADNTLKVLPIEDFNMSDVHLGPNGAKLVSAQIADQILATLGSAHPSQQEGLQP